MAPAVWSTTAKDGGNGPPAVSWRIHLILFGLTISAIGMGTVLFALVLLMGIIRVLGHFTALAGEHTPLEEREKGKPSLKSVVTSRESAGNTAELDEETAVVIAAALAACLRES